MFFFKGYFRYTNWVIITHATGFCSYNQPCLSFLEVGDEHQWCVCHLVIDHIREKNLDSEAKKINVSSYCRCIRETFLSWLWTDRWTFFTSDLSSFRNEIWFTSSYFWQAPNSMGQISSRELYPGLDQRLMSNLYFTAPTTGNFTVPQCKDYMESSKGLLSCPLHCVQTLLNMFYFNKVYLWAGWPGMHNFYSLKSKLFLSTDCIVIVSSDE